VFAAMRQEVLQLPSITAPFALLVNNASVPLAGLLQKLIDRELAAPGVLLHGPNTSGKTTWLNAARRLAAEQGKSLWIQDAIETLAEPELFAALNRAHDRAEPFLLAARRPGAEWPGQLADLRSRLGQAQHIALTVLDVEQSLNVFAAHCAARGIELSAPVRAYLATRSPRDVLGLMQLVEQIDVLTLRRKQKLTVPLVRELLPAV
jgi:ABC-type cobalamin/Fe3+-siderophores transport system ATPase subunit